MKERGREVGRFLGIIFSFVIFFFFVFCSLMDVKAATYAISPIPSNGTITDMCSSLVNDINCSATYNIFQSATPNLYQIDGSRVIKAICFCPNMKLNFQVYGAEGGCISSPRGRLGGRGGIMQGSIPVRVLRNLKPKELTTNMYILVGRYGSCMVYSSWEYVGRGGEASAVWLSALDVSGLLVVAGGGGAGSYTHVDNRIRVCTGGNGLGGNPSITTYHGGTGVETSKSGGGGGGYMAGGWAGFFGYGGSGFLTPLCAGGAGCTYTSSTGRLGNGYVRIWLSP